MDLMKARRLLDELSKWHLMEPNVKAMVTEEDIEEAEHALAYRLPASYHVFVLALNGVLLPNWQFYRPCPIACSALLDTDIVKRNRFIHNDLEVPTSLVGFWANGTGNYLCFDRNAEMDVIVQWVHDAGDGDDVIQPSAATFEEWITRHITEDLPQIGRLG